MLVFALLVVPAGLFGMSMSPAASSEQRRNFRLLAAASGLLWIGLLVWQLQSAIN